VISLNPNGPLTTIIDCLNPANVQASDIGSIKDMLAETQVHTAAARVGTTQQRLR
jgi:hypothetical protein